MPADHLKTARVPARSGVIERAAAVMDTFIDGPEWMGLDDIRRLAGIPRSTTFRILRQLVDLGWLQHDERGYRLGPRVSRYSSRATNCDELRAAASTALTDLSLATGGVAHLGVLEGPAVNYLDKVGGAASASIPSRIGVRIPATDTVSGHVLLASLAPEQADAVLSEVKKPTGQQPLVPKYSTERIHRELQRIRHRNGLAFQPANDCHLGITAIAAPIDGPTGTVAAISLCIRRQVAFEQLAPLVVRAARRTAMVLSTQHHTTA